MRSLVFRVRKEYFDAIVMGKKRVEHRRDSLYWRKRINGKPVTVAVFICGKGVHRRFITAIGLIDTPEWFSEQGQKDVDTPKCYAIYLGSEVDVV